MGFEARLRAYRERAGMSQNELARASDLDPATINRLEKGSRSPSNRAHVEQIAGALGLSPAERDELLASAGHLPDVYSSVPASDPTLLAVARVLADAGLSAEDRQEYRAVIEALSRRWAPPDAGDAS